MKKIISLFLLLIAGSSFGQIMMNVYVSNGTTMSIPVNTIDSITYTGNPTPLIIITNAISNITPSTAYVEGEILDDGGSPITKHGICYSYTPNPDMQSVLYYDTTIIAGIPVAFPVSGVVNLGIGAIGTFGSNISISPDSTVYVRAFAVNNSSQDTTYGNELVFTSPNSLFTAGTGVADIDGNIYTSVIVGNQEWMVENLKTTRYANGDLIPNITDGTLWTNQTAGAWSHYDNDPANENPYGKLYNWYAVDDVRNVCPTGWHVPTTAEWLQLTDTTCGGIYIAGPKMRSLSNWDAGVTATNESGFSAEPSGYRDGSLFNGLVSILGFAQHADWWSATVDSLNPSLSEYQQTLGDEDSCETHLMNQNVGLAIRCIKN